MKLSQPVPQSFTPSLLHPAAAIYMHAVNGKERGKKIERNRKEKTLLHSSWSMPFSSTHFRDSPITPLSFLNLCHLPCVFSNPGSTFCTSFFIHGASNAIPNWYGTCHTALQQPFILLDLCHPPAYSTQPIQHFSCTPGHLSWTMMSTSLICVVISGPNTLLNSYNIFQTFFCSSLNWHQPLACWPWTCNFLLASPLTFSLQASTK